MLISVMKAKLNSWVCQKCFSSGADERRWKYLSRYPIIWN